MKIVEAISDTNIGGAGMVLINRLSESPENAKNTVVLIPCGSALKDKLLKAGVNIIEVDGCYDSSLDIIAIRKYIDILKKIKPNVVNCHGCLSCRIAAIICRVPLRIYTRHCVFPLSSFQQSFIYRAVFRISQGIMSHHIIAVAHSAKENLLMLGANEKNITVIVNGVPAVDKLNDDERFYLRNKLSIPESAVVVGIFARLEEYKGHIDLLYAARILIGKSKKYRFLIVGDGSCRKRLEEVTIQLGIENYVIFTGFVDDITPYMNIIDINVNCSFGTETSSLALSEGMSLGKPCVVSDYGGNPYMIQNGKNGFVYPVRDYMALSKRILLLSFSKTLYEKMSENAYKRYNEELNAKKMSRQTYDLYRTLLYRQHF